MQKGLWGCIASFGIDVETTADEVFGLTGDAVPRFRVEFVFADLYFFNQVLNTKRFKFGGQIYYSELKG